MLYLFPPSFKLMNNPRFPTAEQRLEGEAVHSHAQLIFSIKKRKLQSLRSRSGSVRLGPAVLNSLGQAMGGISNTQRGYFRTLAAITVSRVTDKEYYMQINFCLGRAISCASRYLIQLPGPCPRAGICPSGSSFSIQMCGIRSLLDNPDAQTQELNPASDYSPPVATLVQ